MPPHADEKNNNNKGRVLFGAASAPRATSQHKFWSRQFFATKLRVDRQWLYTIAFCALSIGLYLSPLLESSLYASGIDWFGSSQRADVTGQPMRAPTVNAGLSSAGSETNQAAATASDSADSYACKHTYTMTMVSQDPVMIYLHNFLQEGEAEHMISIA